MPVAPRVAEGLLLSLLAEEPWYISLLRLTVGVASWVVFCNFWHLAQTILGSFKMLFRALEKIGDFQNDVLWFFYREV